MDQAGGADFLDDDLFNSLLNDVTPLGLRQSPCQSGAEPGEAFATLKGEGFDDTVAGTVNWFNFDGAALQHAQPLLSSNPLAGHQQPTAGKRLRLSQPVGLGSKMCPKKVLYMGFGAACHCQFRGAADPSSSGARSCRAALRPSMLALVLPSE